MAALHTIGWWQWTVWFAVRFFKFWGMVASGALLGFKMVASGALLGGPLYALLFALLVGPLAALLYGLFFNFMNKYYFLF